MFKKLFKGMLGFAFVFTLVGCANQTNDNENTKQTTNTNTSQTTDTDSQVLIAYFSKTGNTEEVANQIQSLTDGTLVEIQPVNAYPESYQETVDIAQKELDENARPEIQEIDVDFNDYDTIFLGYPIWWHDAPMVIYTFLENYDLEGKTIIPFCTSGGSDIEESMEGIREAANGAKVLDGYTANNIDDIANWLESLDY